MQIQNALYGIFGAWRLLQFDRTGLQHFGVSPQAFWHSFWAAAIVLPADGIATVLLSLEPTGESGLSDTVHSVLVYLEIYAIQWVLFPLVMAAFAESIQRGERFILFIVAWNWSNVIRAALILPAIAVFASQGIESTGWGAAIYMAALMLTFIYAGFVARAALDVPVLTALGVVLLEIGLAIVLWFSAQALIG
jgi:hypothetical protein